MPLSCQIWRSTTVNDGSPWSRFAIDQGRHYSHTDLGVSADDHGRSYKAAISFNARALSRAVLGPRKGTRW